MSRASEKAAAKTSSVRDDKVWMCCTVMQIVNTLPLNVDEARDILRITNEVMRYKHGDRWKYTVEEYAQYLKGKNPDGLKASGAHTFTKRGGRKS
jgi:hypothetical protein